MIAARMGGLNIFYNLICVLMLTKSQLHQVFPLKQPSNFTIKIATKLFFKKLFLVGNTTASFAIVLPTFLHRSST